jgi:hypothetical protein
VPAAAAGAVRRCVVVAEFVKTFPRKRVDRLYALTHNHPVTPPNCLTPQPWNGICISDAELMSARDQRNAPKGTRTMSNKLATLALTALLGAPVSAIAIPITYQIKFTGVTGLVTTQFEDGSTHVEDVNGKVYFGLFAVDDEILNTDGINKSGHVEFFYIQMEDNIWGYNLAINNSFMGFRGPDPNDPSCVSCLVAPSPGFDVVNGAITALRGGVYGEADTPFVDFSFPGPNAFGAQGGLLGAGERHTYVGTNSHGIQGTMEIFRVPEPGTLSLFGVGILFLTFLRSRERN